ncbi:MAG: ACP S-malonyltransferase [Gemmatimonadota bacterium]
MSGASRVALLLPGQGSQFVGMGRELAEASAEIRDLYAEADDILAYPLSRICWEGPEQILTRTDNAQPAILLHSYAVWRALPPTIRDRVVVAAGHSVGEFSAYVAAGTLSFADALRLVRRRGELMAAAGKARPGTMAAVIGLDPDAVRAACEASRGTVVPANLNAPGQVVVSGEVDAVARAEEQALARGARRVIPLNVSGAFHSPLMQAAREGLRRALHEVPLADPGFPVVANASATPVRDAGGAARLLIEQLTSPVRWVECVETMRSFDADRWLEIGPGTVLSGLVRRIDRSLAVTAVGDPTSIETLAGDVGDA